jgi:hypothetical protein
MDRTKTGDLLTTQMSLIDRDCDGSGPTMSLSSKCQATEELHQMIKNNILPYSTGLSTVNNP